jgi:hypothetical protein
MGVRDELMGFFLTVTRIDNSTQRQEFLRQMDYSQLIHSINTNASKLEFCAELINELARKGKKDLLNFINNLIELPQGQIGEDRRDNLQNIKARIETLNIKDFTAEFLGHVPEQGKPPKPSVGGIFIFPLSILAGLIFFAFLSSQNKSPSLSPPPNPEPSPSPTQPPSPPPPPLLQQRTFRFDVRVDHRDNRQVVQRFCVPEASEIVNWQPPSMISDGGYSYFEKIEIVAGQPNCVDVYAHLQGKGVREIGGIIVDYLGRGWLKADIIVNYIPR